MARARRNFKDNAAKAIALAVLAPMLLGGIGRLDSLDDRLLAAHNRERASLGIAPLAWDAGLAADAADWARHLSEVGAMVHADERDHDPQGENLWAGTSGFYSPEAMVGLWIDEKRDFKPGVFPANSRTGNFGDVGHYTQLMWRSTRRVGCAVAAGEGDDFLVCRYSEAGNMIGERPF